ncbi:MAG: hypothetical protein JJT94_02975 [Bernardetiaceae bacterium]|nr:hypothetical protein [Bernardetiaceae bacterium]
MAKEKPKSEQNAYDKILKENIVAYVLKLSKRQLGFEIKEHRFIKDKLQTTLERESDFLLQITTTDDKQFILQLEFQAQDEDKMIFRMQEYHAILQKKYQMPIYQVVYYLGEKPSKMRSTLEPSEIFEGFALKSFRDYSYEEFLESEYAEEVIMAVLTDFGEETREAVVRKILMRLSQLKSDKTALNKYVRQLLILARLRNQLPNIIQNELGNMGTIGYDIEQDEVYLQGLEKGKAAGLEEGKAAGLEEGMEKGKAAGIEEGMEKAQIDFAISCLLKGLSLEMTAELTGLSEEQVQEIKDGLDKEEE